MINEEIVPTFSIEAMFQAICQAAGFDCAFGTTHYTTIHVFTV